MTVSPVLNVCFHGIGSPRRELEPGEDEYWISVSAFHQILDAIAGRKDIRLSFDDGNISDVEVGLPALLERKLTATFFPLAGRLDQPGSVTSAALRELRRNQMSIGTHGMDHIPWRGLNGDQQRREFVQARERLAEASDGPILEAALPLGRYDRKLLSQLRRLGSPSLSSSRSGPREWDTASAVQTAARCTSMDSHFVVIERAASQVVFGHPEGVLDAP
jgi:peptidoglycan/xylan/chitin deacetylase (PgdA/CDA1 family)